MNSKLKLEVVNSSPSRSTNGVGSSSIHQQQQTPSSSSSNFHLPELKPVINNNGNHHDGANESQNVSTEEEISAYDRQQQQIEIAIAAAINGGSITSPFRESDGGGGASSSSFTSSNDEFLHRLVNAVRREPCLYNPNDEHHGNKHSSAQYRAAVWQRLVKELNYHEDAHSLQTQWKRLRERYVRERRRKAAKDFFDPLTGGVSSVKNFHLMHWIDEFLPDLSNNQSSSSNSSNNVSMHLPGTSISDRQQHQQQQYFEPLNNGFGNIGICKSSLNGPSTSAIGTKKNESTNGSPSSTSSETSTISGGGGQQQQIILPNLRHQIKSEINGGSAFYSTGKANQLMYKLREELGLRMPPVIGLVNNIGQEQQHQQQHLNISPHQLQMPTETLRPISAECYQQIGILPQQQHSIQDIQNDYFHQQQPSSSASATNEAAISSPYLNRRKRSALDSLMLLQQQQSTNNERILQRNNNNRTKQEQQQQQIIAESEHLLIQQQQQQQIPSIALAIHNNQQQQHHLPSPHQAPSVHSIRSSNSNGSTSLQQQQNNLNNLLLPSTSSTITVGQQQQASSSTTNTTIIPQQQQQQLFQQQEEIVENEEGNFIEMIVRHLKNLNEDEKVVTKMNIQRILMDARFGRGACVRMFNDELAMEQQRQQQQQQQHLQQ